MKVMAIPSRFVPRPRVTSIVQFYERGNLRSPFAGPFAAIVTGVGKNNEVDLMVFYRTSSFPKTAVPCCDAQAKSVLADSELVKFWDWPPEDK